VLLVEADREVNAFLTELLIQIGFHVIAAAGSADALAKAQQKKHDIHLLVADAELPGVSGARFATRFHACRPEAKIVLVTGLQQGLRLREGGWSFISASVIVDALKLKLNQLLGPREPPRPGFPRAS
jgi:CheY-like chemotaxis protein